MNIVYEPEYIKDYANTLYQQAKYVIPLHFFIGIFLGFFVFNAISIMLMDMLDFLIPSIGVLVGGVMGLQVGRNRASQLKLQAQLALCQLNIEENTRPSNVQEPRLKV